MNKNIIQEEINEFVTSGTLPISFYNSEVIFIEKNENQYVASAMYKKYNQFNVLHRKTDKIISKIYDIY